MTAALVSDGSVVSASDCWRSLAAAGCIMAVGVDGVDRGTVTKTTIVVAAC